MSKKRIGVWLKVPASAGGAFQYNLTIIRALDQMVKKNTERYDLIFFVGDEVYEDILKPFQYRQISVKRFYKKSNIFQKIGSKLTFLFKSYRIWQKVNKIPYLFSFHKVYRLSPDLMIFPGSEEIAFEFDLPFITPIHDLMHRYESGFSEANSPEDIKYLDFLFGGFAAKAQTILVDSEISKQQVMESYGAVLQAKVQVLPFIPPPYVLDNKPTTELNLEAKKKFSLPDKFIFYPAQFWSHKNHEIILDALHILKKQGVEVSVIFVGSKKNNYEKIQQLIKDKLLENNVLILGYVSNEDIVGIYKNAKALVMPTFFGPTNIPIVEAIHLDVPVLCSDVYGHPEQVGNPEALFPPYQPEILAEKIKRLWQEDGYGNYLVAKQQRKKKELDITFFSKKLEDAIQKSFKN